MKVLYCGAFNIHVFDQSLYNALKSWSSIDLFKFSWGIYFKNHKYKNNLEKIYYGFQNRYKIGSTINRINKDLINKVEEVKPDVIFLTRPIHIKPSTIDLIKKNNSMIKIVMYNNDDPFSNKNPKWLFRFFLKLINKSDLIFSFREKNIEEYIKRGAKNVKHLPPFVDVDFIKVNNTSQKRYDCQFIGHYENDNRDSFFYELYKSKFNFRIIGSGWTKSPFFNKLKDYIQDKSLNFNDYNTELQQSKINLVFYSSINNDEYTIRNFEIPQTKTLMLAYRTNGVLKFFKENHEIILFSDAAEMKNKIAYYLKNENERKQIIDNAFKRIQKENYSNYGRINEIVIPSIKELFC